MYKKITKYENIIEDDDEFDISKYNRPLVKRREGDNGMWVQTSQDSYYDEFFWLDNELGKWFAILLSEIKIELNARRKEQFYIGNEDYIKINVAQRVLLEACAKYEIFRPLLELYKKDVFEIRYVNYDASRYGGGLGNIPVPYFNYIGSKKEKEYCMSIPVYDLIAKYCYVNPLQNIVSGFTDASYGMHKSICEVNISEHPSVLFDIYNSISFRYSMYGNKKYIRKLRKRKLMFMLLIAGGIK